MKPYVAPEMEVVEFSSTGDFLTASNDSGVSGDADTGGGEEED